MDLIGLISNAVSVPVIASGGLSTAKDFVSVIKETNVDAVAIADAFHYKRLCVNDIRDIAKSEGIRVRHYVSK
jgi:cyclase